MRHRAYNMAINLTILLSTIMMVKIPRFRMGENVGGGKRGGSNLPPPLTNK